jgi:hypothetical protein
MHNKLFTMKIWKNYDNLLWNAVNLEITQTSFILFINIIKHL